MKKEGERMKRKRETEKRRHNSGKDRMGKEIKKGRVEQTERKKERE